MVRSIRTAIIAGVALCAISAVPAAYAQNSPEGKPTETIDALMQRWTGIERQREELAARWREQKPILEQQLFLLREEEKTLTNLFQKTSSNQDEVAAKRLQLLEQQTVLERQQDRLGLSLKKATASIEDIYYQLPPPMQAAWQDQLPRLRSELLSPSERLRTVTEMLSQLDDFNRKINLHEALVEDPGGGQFLVRQVFLGLSRGWYVNADGSRAAYGTATADGWRWQESADGERIARMISILERRQDAALLSMPLELSGGEAR